MKPRERRETGEMDLFRSRLDQIINMNHELVRLAKTVSWEAIEARCGEVYSDGPGMPPLPTRLMAGLAILKHTFNLSDRSSAPAGWRTRISSSSAARPSSGMICLSTVPR